MTETPNHALQRTRPSRPGCNPRVPCAGSLSLVRWVAFLKATFWLESALFSVLQADNNDSTRHDLSRSLDRYRFPQFLRPVWPSATQPNHSMDRTAGSRLGRL